MHPIYFNDLSKGWQEKELGAVVATKRGYTWEKSQEVEHATAQSIPVIRIPNVQQSLDMTDTLHLEGVSEDARKEAAVTQGWCLMVGSNGNPNRIGDAVFVNKDEAMVFASFLLGLRPKPDSGVEDRFLSFWFQLHRVHQFISQTSQMTTGLANLSWSACRRLPVRFPSSQSEQARITGQLSDSDEASTALRTQIDNAERVRTGILQGAFVGGLVPRSPRASTPQLGGIPSHWDIVRLGRVLAEPPFTGVSPQSRPNPPGTPILNVGCIKDGSCTTSNLTFVDVDADTQQLCAARKDDFFVLRGNGNRLLVVTGGWLREDPSTPCIFSDKLIRLRFKRDRVVTGFFPYMWQSYQFLRRLQSKAQSSSGLWMFTKRDITREWVALPPKNEQQEIVEHLDTVTECIAALNNQLRRSERLRTALLQDLLTGQMRIKP